MIRKFSEISTNKDLIRYLLSSDRSRKNFYHYTTYSIYKSIINSGYWFLSSFDDLNDIYEADRIDSSLKNSTFIASFSRNESESIAMWYMYSSPHEEGVRIEIESIAMRKWIKQISVAFEVIGNKELGFQVSNEPILSQPKMHAISYFEPNKSKFYWSTQTLLVSENKELLNFQSDIQTHGYVKHAAWAYEEEMRLSIKIDPVRQYKKIAIPIPDYVTKSMKIMIGPSYIIEKSKPSFFRKSELYGKVRLK